MNKARWDRSAQRCGTSQAGPHKKYKAGPINKQAEKPALITTAGLSGIKQNATDLPVRTLTIRNSTASVKLDDQGFDGLSRQFDLDLTWLRHANWTLNFFNYFRKGDGWLVGNRLNQFSSYNSELFASNFKIAGLLTDQLEFGLQLQWALLEARSQQIWQIRQRQVYADHNAPDSSFNDPRLTAQFKSRYKIGAYSDLYLVYNRGGTLYTSGQQPTEAWLPAIADLWQAPNQSLWTAKMRYAFRNGNKHFINLISLNYQSLNDVALTLLLFTNKEKFNEKVDHIGLTARQ